VTISAEELLTLTPDEQEAVLAAQKPTPCGLTDLHRGGSGHHPGVG